MRFTQDARQTPHHCVFYPQLGGRNDLGFIEADGLLTGLHDTAYVSVTALHEIAKKFPQAGLVERSALILALAETEALKAENEDLRAQMAEYDKELDAIHHLKARGYKPSAKPGRKPTTQKAA